jgi:hypothetical protein
MGTAFHAMMDPIMRLTPKQVRGFADAIAYVAEIRERRRFQAWVEHEAIADWLPSSPWTTADLVLFTKDELHIIDFKFGKVPVEAVGNKQLLFYARTYADLAPKAHEVHLHIVQPFADNFTEWVADVTEVLNFAVQAKLSDQLVLAQDTTFGPGDHCMFCPANPHSRGDKGKPLCPAMLQLLYPQEIDEQEMLADD